MLEASKAFRWMSWIAHIIFTMVLLVLPEGVSAIGDNVQYWSSEFPRANFVRRKVDISEIRSDGATRDSIRPIVNPRFSAVSERLGIAELEPVISFEVNFEARAYPLRLLVWHELVNDEISGVPILVTFSPLGNSSRVYDRRVAGKTTLFGNTGRTRHFDTIMYDATSQSWWQRFTGRAIIGERIGERLKALPSRVESLARFRERHPEGEVMVPSDPNHHPYGTTPYVRMDTSEGYGLEAYVLAEDVKPYDLVVAVGDEAWTFNRLKNKGAVDREDLFVGWEPGQNSIHDTKWIQFGRDVGNIIVRHFDPNEEEWVDMLHAVSFAFSFEAFHPNGVLYSW